MIRHADDANTSRSALRTTLLGPMRCSRAADVEPHSPIRMFGNVRAVGSNVFLAGSERPLKIIVVSFDIFARPQDGFILRGEACSRQAGTNKRHLGHDASPPDVTDSGETNGASPAACFVFRRNALNKVSTCFIHRVTFYAYVTVLLHRSGQTQCQARAPDCEKIGVIQRLRFVPAFASGHSCFDGGVDAATVIACQ